MISERAGYPVTTPRLKLDCFFLGVSLNLHKLQ